MVSAVDIMSAAEIATFSLLLNVSAMREAIMERRMVK